MTLSWWLIIALSTVKPFPGLHQIRPPVGYLSPLVDQPTQYGKNDYEGKNTDSKRYF